jgi:hypothetical protein
MQSKMIQAGGSAALVLTGIALAAVLMAAQTPTAESPMKFTATTDNIADAHDSIQINLSRFSTDAESSQVTSAWTQAVARAAAAGGRGGAGGGIPGRQMVVVEGDSTHSLMYAKLTDTGGNQMPPRGPLSKDNIATIMAWIDNGATEADFGTVQPIFNANCISCHAGATPRAGLSLESFEDVMKGAPLAGGTRAKATTPDGSLEEALEKAPTVGYLWSSEAFGYSIRYAVKEPQPDGGSRIVLITNQRLGGVDNKWSPVGATPGKYEFSVIELRLNSKGQGEGKISLTDKLAVDSTGKVIALDDYSALPVVLKNVTVGTPDKY